LFLLSAVAGRHFDTPRGHDEGPAIPAIANIPLEFSVPDAVKAKFQGVSAL
jgi:hypothetical protein